MKNPAPIPWRNCVVQDKTVLFCQSGVGIVFVPIIMSSSSNMKSLSRIAQCISVSAILFIIMPCSF